MIDRSVPAPPDLFRSRLLLPAAAGYALSALLGLGAVLALFLPDALPALREDLVLGGIVSPSAIGTWTVIHVSVIAAGFLCAAAMAVCLTLELRIDPGRGLDLLHTGAQWLLWGVRISGAGVLVLLICKVARYLYACAFINEGVYIAYAMLVSEAMMAVQAAGLFVLIQRFLDCVSTAAAGMGYTRLCGKIDSTTIPGFTSTGFLLMALVNGYLAVERMFTVTIVEDFGGDYYSLLCPSHPVFRFTVGMFVLGAFANLCIGIYLRRYKRTAERLVFRSMHTRLREES